MTDVHAHCDNLDGDAIEGFVAVLPLPGWSDHARELRLMAHPAVLEAAVIAVIGVPQPTHGEELAAAVTLRPDGTDTEELRDYVKARVAAYKYPRQGVVGRRAAQTADRQAARAGNRRPAGGDVVRLIMLAPPGAGKGTHSVQLMRATGVRHLSSGDVLRAEIGRGTELGRRLAGYTTRGDLVPDDLIFEILTPAVVAAARDSGGYLLLDGFPRTMPQALRTAELGIELDLVGDAAVYLTAPEQVLIDRMLARPQREGRADDTPEVIRHRLDVFAVATEPLVDYYRGRGILVTVDANRPAEVVQADIRGRLAERGVPETRAPSRHVSGGPVR